MMEAMTIPPVTIESRRPIPVAAALMLEQGVNRLPVVDGGQLVGIVTRADLVRAFARDDAEIKQEIRDEDVIIEPRFCGPDYGLPDGPRCSCRTAFLY